MKFRTQHFVLPMFCLASLLPAASPLNAQQQPAASNTPAATADKSAASEQAAEIAWLHEYTKRANAIRDSISDPEKRKQAEAQLEVEMLKTAPPKIKAHAELTAKYTKVRAITDPDARVTAFTALWKVSPQTYAGAGRVVASEWKPYIKANHEDTQHVEHILNELRDTLLAGSAMRASEFDLEIASFLHQEGYMTDYAHSMAEQSLATFHEDDYLEVASRKDGAAYDKDGAVIPPAKLAYNGNLYRGQLAERYTLLGQLQLAMNDKASASQSFAKAIEIHPDREAYLAEANLKEESGDKKTAYELLSKAYLTGYIDAATVQHMKDLYRTLYPTKTQRDMDRELDAAYAVTFHNPVTFTPYQPTKDATSRVVIGELFTGADCMPCIAPDLAFDAALSRYNRDQFALLVYHDNAPHDDPLANWVTTERAAYYDTENSTPHAAIDGQIYNLVQGLTIAAQKEADGVLHKIDQERDTAPTAQLKIKATLHGSLVKVQVTGSAQHPDPSTKLRIDLVEKQVSYSGENGIRFHPMIVRSTAWATASTSGKSVASDGAMKATYTFDLKKITASNLEYYIHEDQVTRRRTDGMKSADYREKKADIDPDNLAIVAFVQSDSNKKISQAAYVDVAGSEASKQTTAANR